MDDNQTTPEMEEPLDPAFEKVRRKMVRLLAVSIGTMMIGVLAVLAAVVWRINDAGGASSFPIALPVGAVVDQMSVSADAIGFLVTLPDGGSELIMYDRDNGSVMSRSAVIGELPLQGSVPQ